MLIAVGPHSQAQLSQLYYAFAIAIALGRTIVLPEVRQTTTVT